MKFNKLIKGRALYSQNDGVWVAKGLDVFKIDFSGKKITKTIRIGGFVERAIASVRISRQLLRVGVHHLLPLKNGNLLITLKKRTLILSPKGETVAEFSGYRGNKPGHGGICITPDGTIFFGEYTLNPNRDHDTKLYRSTDNGESFQCIKTFDADEVRHIHFVQYDKYDNCLWLGTGDRDEECKLLRSDDNGDNWYVVGEGSQNWRCIRISCLKDALVWGTDAGSVPDQNYVVRMDKATKGIECIAELEGPCHGNAITADGRVFVSTGVEGGENEKDRFARMKVLEGNVPQELLALKKDIFPLIAQYGVMRFPLGAENSDRVLFTAMGLKKYGETVLIDEK